MNAWSVALREQAALLRFTTSPRGRGYLNSMQSYWSFETEGPEGLLADLQAVVLDRAEPIYVDPLVVELIEHAAPSFNPEPMLASDPTTPIGFMYFGAPLSLIDIHGKVITIRAMSWLPILVSEQGEGEDVTSGGCWVSLYTDNRDLDDYDTGLRAEWRELTSCHLGYVHGGLISWGVEPADLNVATEQQPSSGGGASVGGDELRMLMNDWWQIIQATWRLSHQLVQAPERADRATRRDRDVTAVRHESGEPREDVTVIRLRRQKLEANGDRPARRIGEDFHYVNRGGWRNQHYPKLGPARLPDGSSNPESHRQIWIAPYLKGNLDAELRRTSRVFHWSK